MHLENAWERPLYRFLDGLDFSAPVGYDSGFRSDCINFWDLDR